MLSAALCVYLPFLLLFCWVFYFPIPSDAGRREEEGVHLSPAPLCCPRTSQLPVVRRRMSLAMLIAVPSPFSRTASSPSSPGFRSRLPVPCKSPPSIQAAAPSLPLAPASGPSSSARLDERRAAREARPRPWSDRSTWAPSKPRSVRPSPAQLATLCPRRLFDRQQARHGRDRPWAVAASPCRSSTSTSAALSSAAAAVAPSGLRGILKSRCDAPRAAKKKVVWSADSTVVEVSRWIKEAEEYDDDQEVYEAMCF